MIYLIAFFKYPFFRFIFQMFFSNLSIIFFSFNTDNSIIIKWRSHLFYVSTKILFLSSTTRTSSDLWYLLNSFSFSLNPPSGLSLKNFSSFSLFFHFCLPKWLLRNDFVYDQLFFPKLHPFLLYFYTATGFLIQYEEFARVASCQNLSFCWTVPSFHKFHLYNFLVIIQMIFYLRNSLLEFLLLCFCFVVVFFCWI